MAATLQTRRPKGRTMPRPKQEVTKESRIDVRMHPALRAALEKVARMEGRTLSQLCERTMRAFAIRVLKEAGEDVTELQELP